VRRHGPAHGLRARAITANAQVAWISADGEMQRVLELLADAQVPVAELCMRGDAGAALVALPNAPDWPAARALLGGRAQVDEGVVLVAVVGDGLGDDPEPLRVFRRTLDAECAAPKLVLASALRLAAVVDAERALEVQQALHAAFVTM
jgi:aspartokinase